jgi:hypothetical protein
MGLTVTPEQYVKQLDFAIRHGFQILTYGAPGVGKTDIVSQRVKDAKRKLMVIHPTVMEGVDLKGLGFRVKKKMADGTEIDAADFLPYEMLLQLIMEEEDCVVLLDDLGHAREDVQKALLHVIWAREINGRKISPKIIFMACSNRPKDQAGVKPLNSALVARFSTVLTLVPEPKSWCDWAIKTGQPDIMITFARLYPQYFSGEFIPEPGELSNGPRPRTIAELGKAIKKGLFNELGEDAWSWCEGQIGHNASIHLRALKAVADDMPDPDEVLRKPDTTPLPESVSGLFLLTGALPHRVQKKTFHGMVVVAERLLGGHQIKTMDGLNISYSMAEVAQSMISDSLKKNPDFVQLPAYNEWLIKNPHLKRS